MPTRRTATSTSRCVPTRITAKYPTAKSTRWTRARGCRAPRASAIRSISRSGRHARRARTPPGTPLGARPARLAHRVLGDGRGAAGARLRDPRRRQRPAVPPPRERGRPDRAARGRPLARMWMHNGMVRLDSDKMSKSVGNVFVLHEALERSRPRRADHVLLRRPLPPAGRVRRRAPEPRPQARCDRIREAARGLVDGPSPEWSAPLRRALLRRAGRTTSTPRGRWRRCSTGSGRPTAARPGTVGSDDLRAMLDVFGLANLLDRLEVQPPPRGAGARCSEREQRAGPARLRARRPPARRAARDGLGGARRSRRPELLRVMIAAGPMIVYGRNPVREAIRGPRTVKRVWASKNAAPRAVAGGARGPSPAVADAGRARAAVRFAGTSGGVRRGRVRFATPTPATLLALPEPLIVALDQVQDPQNLGAIARSAECAGAAGLVMPERRSAEVTPAVCKASAGAVEHLPVARIRNLADFLADAKRAGLWCYGADADGAQRLRRGRTSPARWCWCSARRDGACDRAWPAACDVLVSIPLQGQGRVAQRERRGRGADLRRRRAIGKEPCSALDTRALLCQARAVNKDQLEL